MKIFFLVSALSLFSSLPCCAIELSLEENRAERGNIGYVDMRRLFQLFPETQRAKEAFEETVRQTEEQVNLRKAELLRLRAELSRMKADREVLAAAPMRPNSVPQGPQGAAAAAAQPPAPPVKAPAPAPKPPAVAPSSASIVSGLPGFSGASSAAVHEPLLVGLPAATTAAAPVAEPAPTDPAIAATAQPVRPNAAPNGPQDAAAAAAQALTPLQMIDERIAQKTAEIAQKEGDHKKQLAEAEKNLLDLESRKSEVLLGKIYKVLQEVARQEGVSVVVDKSAILYGHAAVDLTEKVLKRLKGT